MLYKIVAVSAVVTFLMLANTSITVADDTLFHGDYARAEREIFDLVNQHRERHGLAPLYGHAELGSLARAHSHDMGIRRFYSHVNPDGVTPGERINTGLSDRYYLTRTAENIAYQQSSSGFTNTPAARLGREFMDSWMNSPGHRQNILNPESTHIGVGLSRAGNRVYATQKFVSYIARLDGSTDGEPLSHSDPTVGFVLNPAIRDPGMLVVRVDLPDPSARWPISGNRFYTGFGYVEPGWIDTTRFTVRLPVDEYGPGLYAIRLGTGGGTSTQTRTFRFPVGSRAR